MVEAAVVVLCIQWVQTRTEYAQFFSEKPFTTLLSVHCNAHEITSVRPSVRPVSVDKIVTLFMDRSPPNLEHGYTLYHTEENVFKQFDLN